MGIRFFPKNALLWGRAAASPLFNPEPSPGASPQRGNEKKTPFSGKLPQNPSASPACRRSRAAAPGIPPGAFLGRARSGSGAKET